VSCLHFSLSCLSRLSRLFVLSGFFGGVIHFVNGSKSLWDWNRSFDELRMEAPPLLRSFGRPGSGTGSDLLIGLQGLFYISIILFSL